MNPFFFPYLAPFRRKDFKLSLQASFNFTKYCLSTIMLPKPGQTFGSTNLKHLTWKWISDWICLRTLSTLTMSHRRVLTKSLFSQPVFYFENFPYKFPSLLKIMLQVICCKYCRRPPRIFLCGKNICKKSDRC